MLNDAKKNELKERLLEEKERLEAQIQRENQDIADQTADQANENTYSNHLADDGGYLMEIDRTTTIRSNLEETLQQIERALQRMDEGTYGTSEVSGKPIPVERLEALPWAATLVDE
jgi:DnaK suppressor protein